MLGGGAIQKPLVCLAALGFCLPQSAWAAGVAPGRTPVVVDVELADGGVLLGQVVNGQGRSLARIPVSFWTRDRQIAATQTDANGCFAVGGLRGGVYQVVTTTGQGTFRLWTPGNAPPLARKGALLVVDREVVRGQIPGMGALTFWLSNPWVLAGVVATAVAVPIAINNAQRPSSP